MSNKNDVNVIVAEHLDLGDGWEVRRLECQEKPGYCYCVCDKDLNGSYYYLDKTVRMINGKEVKTSPSTGLGFAVLEQKIKKHDIAGINDEFVNPIKKAIQQTILEPKTQVVYASEYLHQMTDDHKAEIDRMKGLMTNNSIKDYKEDFFKQQAKTDLKHFEPKIEMVINRSVDNTNKIFLAQPVIPQKTSRTTELQDGWKLVERVSKRTGEKCIAIVDANGNGRAFYENGEEANIKANKIGERQETDVLISGYDHIADLLAEKNIKTIIDEFVPRKKKSIFGNLFSKKPLRNIDNNEDVSMGTHSAKNRSNSLESM